MSNDLGDDLSDELRPILKAPLTHTWMPPTEKQVKQSNDRRRWSPTERTDHTANGYSGSKTCRAISNHTRSHTFTEIDKFADTPRHHVIVSSR